MNDSRKSRIAAAAVLATTLVAAFAALGGVGVATGAISAVQYQYGAKVTICHKGKSITVGKPAVAAHVRKHGDTVGPCSSAAAKAKATKAKKAEQAKKAELVAKAKKAEQAKEAEHAKPAPSKADSEQPTDSERGKPGNGKGHGKGK